MLQEGGSFLRAGPSGHSGSAPAAAGPRGRGGPEGGAPEAAVGRPSGVSFSHVSGAESEHFDGNGKAAEVLSAAGL